MIFHTLKYQRVNGCVSKQPKNRSLFECGQLIYLESRWIATAFDASKPGKNKKTEI